MKVDAEKNPWMFSAVTHIDGKPIGKPSYVKCSRCDKWVKYGHMDEHYQRKH